MSLKEYTKKDTNRYELDITVDAETFNNAIKKAYQKNGKKISIPGFRKGKAPMSIIEKFYGEGAFFEDALDIVYPEAVEAAIKESGLKFVDDKVDFNLVSVSKADGAEFKVTITTEPEIEIDGYKGLNAEKVKVVVTDEEIDEEISRMADRNARLIEITDRPAKNGDITVIDFEGFVDGKAFEGGKGESYSLTLGSGSFIPGFEEQIEGHVNGDEFDVNVTFPEDYQADDLKGKPAVFKCKLHEIKVRELPEIDDEFAKDVSEFDTLADLKSDLKAKSLDRKEKQSEADTENQLSEQLVELVKGEIPQAMFDRRAEQSVEEFAYRLQAQGMDMKTYMKYMGGNADEFKKTFMPQAEKQVKLRLALEKIAELEKIVPTAEEIESEYEKLAKAYNIDVDKAKAAVGEADLARDIAVQKALDFVKENANIKEVDKKTEVSEEKLAAKKPATKKTAAKKTAEKESSDSKTAKAETKPAAKQTATKKSAASTAKKTGTAAKKTSTKKKAEDAE